MEGVGGERELSISIKNWPGKDDELVEFYDARDQFLGVGNYDFKTHFPYDCHSVNLAIRRFRKCRSQPEAVSSSLYFLRHVCI